MVYTPHTEAQREEMIKTIGLNSISDLYKEVPSSVLDPKIDLPASLSEPELVAEMRRLSAKWDDDLNNTGIVGRCWSCREPVEGGFEWNWVACLRQT